MSRFLIKKPNLDVNQKPFAREHKMFLLYFLFVIAIGLGLTRIVNVTYQKNYSLAANDLDQSMGAVMGAYTDILTETDKPADVLLFEGINLIKKNQTEVALLTLEEAVKRDPNYRDAALYTGYTYLRLAQEQKNIETKEQYSNSQFNSSSDSLSISDSLLKAKSYLEKAREIDPLYVQTHQYLAIAYYELGDTQNAQLSTQRAQDFAR